MRIRKNNFDIHSKKSWLRKLTLSVIAFQLFASASAKGYLTYPKTLKVNKSTSLRSSSYFSGSKNWLGVVSKGTTAEILEIDNSKVSGVGLRVRITSGNNYGKTGWIYYSKNPNRRSSTLKDKNNNSINISKNGFKSYFSNVRENKEKKEQAKFLNVQYRLENGAYVTEENTNKIIWKTLGKGKYEIDYDSYTGGDFIPVWAMVRDEYGNKVKKRVWVKKNFDQLATQTKLLVNKYLSPPKVACEPYIQDKYFQDPRPQEEVPVEDKLSVNQKNWLPGCKVLAGELKDSDFNELAKCMSSIKEKARLKARKSNGKYNRDRVFENLYRELNPIEQEFAAMTISAIGEAGTLTPPLEEMVMVMKVLNNRKEYALDKGYENVNELDAALQPFAFSMFNKNKWVYNKKKKKKEYIDNGWEWIIDSKKTGKYESRAIQSYIKYFKSKFDPKKASEKVYHYYSPTAVARTPKWARGKRKEKIKVNGVRLRSSGKRHDFFQKIAWSFRTNKWRKKIDKEKK